MASERRAQVIFSGGRVWTGQPGSSAGGPVQGVAVADGRIVAVGTVAELRPLLGPRTTHVDIGRGMLLPAFGDAHCHPLWGGLAELACDLSRGETPEAWLDLVSAYAAANPELEVLSGEGWNPYPFPGGRPHRRQLDALVPDRPVVLISRDGHSTWANSAALAAAGITAVTPDPPGGHIVRDAEGEPVGVFDEAAKALVERLVPEPTLERQLDGLRRGQAYLHRLGIGAWLDAIVEPDHEAVYLALAARGELSGRVSLALRWDPERGLDQVEHLRDRRAAIAEHGPATVRAHAVKLFADGVVETSTAALLAPYLDGSATDEQHRGPATYEPETLARICDVLDEAGFDIQAHAIGDRGVRDVLDAVARAQGRHGARDRRHAIAHLELVDAADIPRFAELGVIADCQPLWAVHDESDTILRQRLEPARLEARYPFGRLRDAGAALAMGSDWNVSTADPRRIMHVAITRTPSDDPAATPLGPASECLSLEEALRAYTLGSARVMRLEQEAGTIESGKAADLVLLGEDPFEPGTRLPDCPVRLTMVGGRVVHSAA